LIAGQLHPEPRETGAGSQSRAATPGRQFTGLVHAPRQWRLSSGCPTQHSARPVALWTVQGATPRPGLQPAECVALAAQVALLNFCSSVIMIRVYLCVNLRYIAKSLHET